MIKNDQTDPVVVTKGQYRITRFLGGTVKQGVTGNCNKPRAYQNRFTAGNDVLHIGAERDIWFYYDPSTLHKQVTNVTIKQVFSLPASVNNSAKLLG
jgi:hypothetical protein